MVPTGWLSCLHPSWLHGSSASAALESITWYITTQVFFGLYLRSTCTTFSKSAGKMVGFRLVALSSVSQVGAFLLDVRVTVVTIRLCGRTLAKVFQEVLNTPSIHSWWTISFIGGFVKTNFLTPWYYIAGTEAMFADLGHFKQLSIKVTLDFWSWSSLYFMEGREIFQ